MNEPLTSLVKKIDQRINEAAGKYRPGQRLGSFVIVPDAPGLADEFRSLAQQQVAEAREPQHRRGPAPL